MTNTTNIVANESNFIEIMGKMSPFVVLALAKNITSRLDDLAIDGDDGYWLEKPYKFPEYWIPAINGTLEDDDLEIER